MDMLLFVVGIIIVIATAVAIIKRYETRMVLFASGLLMALIAGQPMAALNAFADRMTSGGLIQAILSVMGFAFVMKYTKCDRHLVHLVVNFLKKLRPILIPASVLATFGINIALPSAAGTSAAVGAILIPVLMAAGIHPAMAGAAVFAGTFGSMLSPGSAHNAFVAELSGKTVMEVIGIHNHATITAGIISAVVLTIMAYILRETSGYEMPEDALNGGGTIRVNILKALVPIVPLAILVVGSAGWVPALKMGVPQAMIIGALLGLLVTWTNPTELTRAFFNGMGDAYANVMGIIIAASTFVGGMTAIGLIDKLISYMTTSQSIAGLAATFGPFLLAVLGGSGDAATFAFNEAVTPHAVQFGWGVAQMGALASISGALGRTMSPVAAAAIVCAGIANVNPMEFLKRNAPGMIIAAIVVFLMLR